MFLKRHVLKVSSHVCANSHCFRDIKIAYFFTLKSSSRSLGVTFVMVSFVGKKNQICKSRFGHFALALTISEISPYQIFYLQSTGQDHRVQFYNDTIRWQNVKIYKMIPHIVAASTYHFRDINILNF